MALLRKDDTGECPSLRAMRESADNLRRVRARGQEVTQVANALRDSSLTDGVLTVLKQHLRHLHPLT